jgi:hypothetical protein
MTLSPNEFFFIILVTVVGLSVLFAVVYEASRLSQAKKTPPATASSPEAEAVAASDAPEPRPHSAQAENPPIRHAFDFTDDTLTMILEMPVSMLEDDEALTEGWIRVVGWARMTYRQILEGKLAESQAAASDNAPQESVLTNEALEASLQRLHDSAERRREMRMLLRQKQQT